MKKYKFIWKSLHRYLGFPGGSEDKESGCNTRDPGWISGSKDPLDKERAIQSSVLACRIPWTESLVGYSPWGHKEFDTTE